MAHPAQGWYPDPEAPQQLRYWDGAAWTSHIAPSAPEARPGKPRIWTKVTVAMLVSCLVVIIAAAFGGYTLVQRAHAQSEEKPLQILEEFLSSTAQGDAGWQEFASPRIVEEYPASTPFRGDEATAQALQMDVNYSIADFSLSHPREERSYFARAVVEFTYHYNVLDEPHTTSVVQLVWLTRPLFYDGGDTPGTISLIAEPDRAGPWKVTAIGVPHNGEYDPDMPETFRTTLAAVELREDDAFYCLRPESLLAQMSEESRKNNSARSSCLYGDGTIVGGSEISVEEVGAAFPLIDEFNERTIPEELMKIRPGSDPDHTLIPPFEQFVISGDDASFVLTIAPADDGQGDFVYRVIAIQELQVPQQ